MSNVKIIHRNGAYFVREFYRQSCRPCNLGWHAGTLARPGEGGSVCTHKGRGQWQAGQLGPRGGWYGIGPMYGSPQAAEWLCDALAQAARMPSWDA